MNFRVSDAFHSHIGLKHLRLAVVLGECHSISKAANKLNISQPTATKLLQDLEAELNVRLFWRTNRGIVTTEVGQTLVQQSKALLAQLAHTSQTMADLALGTDGRIVVGALLTATCRLLPAAIQRLRDSRPNVAIEIIEGTNEFLIPRLAEGDLDFIVGRLSELHNAGEIERELLYCEKLYAVVRREHPLTRRNALVVRDLSDCEWILPPLETTLRRQLDKAFRDAGLAAPRCAVESVSVLTNRWLVQNTDLVGIWPASLVDNDPAQSAFAVLPIRLPFAAGEIGISRRPHAPLSPACEALIAELRSSANGIDGLH